MYTHYQKFVYQKQQNPPTKHNLKHVGVSKTRGTPNGWFIMENPIKMDDLGVPPIFGNTHVSPHPHPTSPKPLTNFLPKKHHIAHLQVQVLWPCPPRTWVSHVTCRNGDSKTRKKSGTSWWLFPKIGGKPPKWMVKIMIIMENPY